MYKYNQANHEFGTVLFYYFKMYIVRARTIACYLNDSL